jgi:ATP-dependent DNA helicase PIF1
VQRFFDNIEFVSHVVRKEARPFGGIQIVFCGDFHQLKPVSPLRSIDVKEEYCFKSVLWKDCLGFLSS